MLPQVWGRAGKSLATFGFDPSLCFFSNSQPASVAPNSPLSRFPAPSSPTLAPSTRRQLPHHPLLSFSVSQWVFLSPCVHVSVPQSLGFILWPSHTLSLPHFPFCLCLTFTLTAFGENYKHVDPTISTNLKHAHNLNKLYQDIITKFLKSRVKKEIFKAA